MSVRTMCIKVNQTRVEVGGSSGVAVDGMKEAFFPELGHLLAQEAS